MIAARASKLAPQALRVAQQSRNMSVLSGPPTVKITPTEKLFHGIIMTVGIMAVPSWVLINIKNYKESKD